jgi:hypothetical protein
MSMRSMLVALTLIVATPLAMRAQQSSADFPKARQEFLAGQARQASQTLLIASVHVREEVGRSHDEAVGMRLLDAEGQLEKLATSLKAGTLGNIKSLDQALESIDRLLAQHHLQLASEGIAKPYADVIPAVAKDVERAAFHFERSITLDGHELAAEQVAAVNNARTLSKEIENTKAIPKGAANVVAALQRQVLGQSMVAATR